MFTGKCPLFNPAVINSEVPQKSPHPAEVVEQDRQRHGLNEAGETSHLCPVLVQWGRHVLLSRPQFSWASSYSRNNFGPTYSGWISQSCLSDLCLFFSTFLLKWPQGVDGDWSGEVEWCSGNIRSISKHHRNIWNIEATSATMPSAGTLLVPCWFDDHLLENSLSCPDGLICQQLRS